MTLVIGLKCKMNDYDAVLIGSDRAVSSGQLLKFEENKISIPSGFPILVAGAGSRADIERTGRKFDIILKSAHLSAEDFDCEKWDDFFAKQNAANHMLVASSDKTGKVALHAIAGKCERYDYKPGYAVAGVLHTGALMMIAYLFESKETIDIDEAAIMVAAVIFMTSLVEPGVSQLCNIAVTSHGKVACLSESSYPLLYQKVDLKRSLLKYVWSVCTVNQEFDRIICSGKFVESILNDKGKAKDRVSRKKRTILFIDDKENAATEIGEKVKQLVEKAGHELEFFQSGEEGIKKILEDSANKIKFVLLDVWFENQAMQGASIYNEIKKLKPSLPVVILTHAPDFSDAEYFLKHGATLYFPKADLLKKEKQLMEYLLAISNETEFSWDWE